MTEINPRYKDWLIQALEDIEWAKDTFKHKRYPQTCFITQQASEKAMKAYALFKNADHVRGHSITAVMQAFKINDKLEKAGRYLDRFYISARYPDAYPVGIPSEFIEKADAQRALKEAELILNFVKINLKFK